MSQIEEGTLCEYTYGGAKCTAKKVEREPRMEPSAGEKMLGAMGLTGAALNSMMTRTSHAQANWAKRIAGMDLRDKVACAICRHCQYHCPVHYAIGGRAT